METADKLAQENPTEEPTLYLGDKEKGNQSPLNGEWKLLFTTGKCFCLYCLLKSLGDLARTNKS